MQGLIGYLPAPLRAFMARYPLDLELWLARDAGARLSGELNGLLPPGSEHVALEDAARGVLQGPAVMLVTAEDLRDDDQRGVLLSAARLARPGRPVVYGQQLSSVELLDMINTWQVEQIVSADEQGLEPLVEAILQAHQAIHVEYALSNALAEYRGQRMRLQFAEEQARNQQGRRQQERRQTIARGAADLLRGELAIQLEHVGHLAELTPPLGGRFPPGGKLCQQCLAGLRASEAMLTELQGWARGRGKASAPAARQEELVPLVEAAVALARLDPLAQKRTIKLEVHAAQVKALMERHQMLWIVRDLLRAALRVTDAGDTVEVHVSEEEGRAVIEIWDFARGLRRDNDNPLFASWRGAPGADEVLPLRALAEAVIERQGGTLELTGILRSGTCFRVRLLKY